MGWIEDSVEEFRKLPPAGKIAVGGAAVGVVILAYAQYRANAGGSSTSSTDSSGVPGLGSSPTEWQNWFDGGLTPPTPTSDGAPPDTGGSSGGSSGSSPVATFTAPDASSAATSTATAAQHVSGSAGGPTSAPIQNPTAQQDAQHRGTALPPIQNPTASAQREHRGAAPAIQNPTAAAQAAHRGVTRAAKAAKRFIPTTIRPRASHGRGRAR